MNTAPTALDVAKWMLEEFERRGMLYQDDAVDGIIKRFGKQFVYENREGGTSIDRKVLKEFRKLTPTGVGWERGDKSWNRHKGPGRLYS